MADHDTHDHTGVPGVGGSTDLDAIITASAGQDIADALAGAAAPDAGNVFATMADVGGGGGGLVLLEQHTGNNTSPNLDFTTFISSTYDTYKFEFVNIVPATNSVDLYMRAGTGGGPTYDAGTNYSYEHWRWVNGSQSSGGGTGQTAIVLTSNTDHLSNDANWGVCGSLTLYAPQSAIFKRVVGQYSYLTASSTRQGEDVEGAYEISTALTAVRFLLSSGNVASGTIRAYGVAK